MNKSLLCILTILASTISLQAQQSLSGRIDWQAPVQAGQERWLHFSGAAYTPEWSRLPVCTRLIKLSPGALHATATIEIDERRELTGQGKISGQAMIKESIELHSQVVITRKQPYLRVDFVPLTATGKNQINQVTAYTIKVEEQQTTRRKSKSSFAQNSVLSSGKWVKIKCTENGIYKLSYEQLADMGFSNPANISLWGHGGGMLPQQYDARHSPDDLIQSPIYMETGDDGQFGSGDYILFYGEGPHKWRYSDDGSYYYHEYHLYENANYYFLTDGQSPLNIQTVNNSGLTATSSVNSYDDYAWHEKQEVNLIKSGSQMFGEAFDISTSQSFSFQFDDILSGSQATLVSRFAARSSSGTSYTITANGAVIATPALDNVNIGSYNGTYASTAMTASTFAPTSGSIAIGITFNKNSPSDMGWLDYLYLNVRRPLSFSSGQRAFRDMSSVSKGAVAQFNISTSKSNIRVWDVSETGSITQMELSSISGGYSFKAPADTLRQYVVFDGSSYHSPLAVGEVANQNLHARAAPDMVILTHPTYLSYANELADYRESTSGLDVLVVTPEQVYNEFSSGKTDIAATRNMLKMYYDRAGSTTDMIRYFLLFGDGSYINLPEFLSQHSYLPTYQSSESLEPTYSHVSDDFFGLLDDNEHLIKGAMDIGVGRLPVSNSQQAAAMVNKIKTYESPSSMGDWRNVICLIADDQDSPNNFSHMSQADDLAELIKDNHPVCNLEKIFMDAYKQETSTTGERYPTAITAVNNRVRRGALIMNYTGHGHETGLAEEDIIVTPQILDWENLDNMPLFITATCEFSRFDDYERTSAGEWVLLNPNGGGIALFTTTRLVYSAPNYALNQNFYRHVFETDTINNQPYRLGDVFRMTKVATTSRTLNKRNFTLLGDPSLMLNYPQYKVQAESINGISVSQQTDTLKAFSKITIQAYVTDESGVLLNDYNGTASTTVYDKSRQISTLANDGGDPFTFELQNSVLYRGKSKVESGRFSLTFIVPKDIAYNYGTGKISFYVQSDLTDGHGQYNDVVVGGTADSIPEDGTGPEMELYLNDENFVYGGTTDDSPIFLAQLRDSSGINTVGNGIGHEITMCLDEQTTDVTVLNDYFEADLDSYQSGRVEYPLSDLEEGPHSLSFKAWDIYNNSSEDEIEFVVIKDKELTLSHILNYPNPFSTNTSFFFEHNRPGTELDILIQVFTVSGKLVKSISQTVTTDGYRISGIPWDGRDDFGDPIGRGVYIYKVSVRSADGQKAEHYEKLVIFTP